MMVNQEDENDTELTDRHPSGDQPFKNTFEQLKPDNACESAQTEPLSP